MLKSLCLILISAHAALALGNLHADSDWMVDPRPFKARVSEDKQRGVLIMENGLARRVIKLAPNAATISLENLTTGEELLRAVAPEARVTIDGTAYPVGGLTGQPLQNFLKEEWIKDLKAIPGSYQFSRWEESSIEPRFAWKKRPEWMAKDHPWPAPGRHIVMHYDPPAAPNKNLSGKVIEQETFGAFAPPKSDWKISASKLHARSSFNNEGKSGEIMSLPDCSVFAERDWPKEAVTVELELDAGDDALSNAWGPGFALVAADGQTAHCIIRPHQQVYETPAGLIGKLDRAKPVRLRARLDAGKVHFESSQQGENFTALATIAFPQMPTKIRIGKVGRDGKGGDYNGADQQTTLIRCHMREITFRAKETSTAHQARVDLPKIQIHYEIYDGIPLFSKWLTMTHSQEKPVRLTSFTAHELKLAEVESSVNTAPTSEKFPLWIETDMAFGDMTPEYASPCVKYSADPEYATQVHYDRQTPCLLECKPPLGPDQEISTKTPFASFRVFELLQDSSERERRTLARRKMYRTIAPWTHENPLMFHKVQSDPATIREAIDQAAEVGFEMVIMSFGSGFNFESRDKAYWDRYKELADYGRSKGIALGGYSLLASRGAANPIDNTQGSPARYGVMPCLGTQWGRDYLDNIVAFTRYAGFSVFENDGSYPGDICCATDHPFHRGKEDSQWVMWRAITQQYQALRAEGVYLNIPDWYFLSGANKAGMGYRETNWSLPRAEQEIIERQNIYDGTWSRTQSMGWMFVPLSQYHGGGAAATIEPLREHLPHYEARFANLLGYGVQACFRGPRLYDSEETKAVVKKWVSFYKQHRDVLDNGEIIHLRRPSGRDWDGILHANPLGKEQGMLCIYNPLNEEITRSIRVPMNYTGLRGNCRVSIDGNEPTAMEIDGTQHMTLLLKIPAQGRSFVVFQK
jgi:hypothetical protein